MTNEPTVKLEFKSTKETLIQAYEIFLKSQSDAIDAASNEMEILVIMKDAAQNNLAKIENKIGRLKWGPMREKFNPSLERGL